ncbi:MAG: response regulator [Thermodesulfobacteriota bacterium]
MTAERILIVEDEVVVALELESHLIAQSYVVAGICAYGEEAIEKAASLRPDLVLMDIKLAGSVDGVEASQCIHRLYDIPIVFLTAYSDEPTLQRAKTSEPFGYLVKPFSEAELRTTIEVALHKHHRDKRAKESAIRFSRIMKGIGGAMILTDEEGVIQQTNPLAETLTGWNQYQAVGRHVSEVYVLKDPSTGESVKHMILASPYCNEALCLADYLLVARDQSEIPIESSVIPFEDARGELLGMVFAFHENPADQGSGQDHFSHAANLLLAAELSKVDGDYVAAGSYYERALDVLAQSTGWDGRRVSNLLRDLSSVYRKQGRYGEAQVLELRTARMVGNQEHEGSCHIQMIPGSPYVCAAKS